MTQPIRFVRFSQVYLKSRIVGHWTPCRSNCYHTNDIKVFPYVHTRCRLLPFGCGDAWLLVINHGVVFVGWYLRQCDCCARCTEGASLLGAHGSDQMNRIHKFINYKFDVISVTARILSSTTNLLDKYRRRHRPVAAGCHSNFWQQACVGEWREAPLCHSLCGQGGTTSTPITRQGRVIACIVLLLATFAKFDPTHEHQKEDDPESEPNHTRYHTIRHTIWIPCWCHKQHNSGETREERAPHNQAQPTTAQPPCGGATRDGARGEGHAIRDACKTATYHPRSHCWRTERGWH